MRYRVKDYTVQPVAGGVWLYFTAPQGVQLSSDPDNEIEPFIQEAIRLVIDETAMVVYCSSMQKQSYLEKAKCTPATREICLLFAVPEGKTVSSISAFTIEMDWGESPEDLKDAAESTKQEIRNVAGSCIIPDLELPCLPFEKGDGFSGLYNDGEFYFGDFMPQAGSTVSQLFVGAIIKVTGDNATEDEFAEFPAGSVMSVAHTVSEEEAGYEQGLYGSLQEGDPVYGVTSEITWQKDHYYRVTGFHDIYDMTNHEVVEGYVITYEELDPATLTDLAKQAVERASKSANQLAEFFGLPEALPEIEVATEQEVKDINDDVMGALYGYGKVAVTIHSLMRTGAETTQDLASVIYVDPEKTWAENGYPTLYDDEGTAIDTTTNPAAGDEVFNYQIQSES